MVKTHVYKQCTACNTCKRKTEFHRRPGVGDGFRTTCKTCTRARYRKYFHSPRGRQVIMRTLRKYWATPKGQLSQRKGKKKFLFTPKGRIYKYAKIVRYFRKYPSRKRAQTFLGHAVQRGLIPAAITLKCVICNGEAKHYHHHLGYSQEHIKSVIPLCRECHQKQHSSGRSS